MIGMNPEAASGGDLPFTDAARQLLADASSEADGLQHEYIGTEHLLLALTRQSDGAAALARLGIDQEQVRTLLLATVVPSRAAPAPRVTRPYTSRTQKAISLARESARNLGHAGVGVEHLFVGMFREGRGIAAQVLQHFGLTEEQVLTEVKRSGTDGNTS